MKRAARPYLVTVAVMAATLTLARAIDSRRDEPLAAPLDSIPVDVGGWKGEADPGLRADILAVLAPTSYISRTYRRGNESLQFFVAYYANQRAGESMHSPRHCLPGGGWEFLRYGEISLPVGSGTIAVNENVIQKDGARMCVMYWYQSRRRVIADEYRAKLFLMRDALVERRTGGAIVRIMCPADGTALEGAREFAAAIFPHVRRSIGGDEGR